MRSFVKRFNITNFGYESSPQPLTCHTAGAMKHNTRLVGGNCQLRLTSYDKMEIYSKYFYTNMI